MGKAWVAAVRKHSKYTCNHYYCHLAFAHLRDLIKHNGHPFCGDDAILERGHLVFKRLRAITSGGGRAKVNGVRPKVKAVRHKPTKEGGLEEVIVTQSVRPTREEQVFGLVRVLTKRRAERRNAAPSAKVVATEVRRANERAGVKAESLRRVT